MRRAALLALALLGGTLAQPGRADVIPQGTPFVLRDMQKGPSGSDPGKVALNANPLTGEYVACAHIRDIAPWTIRCSHRASDDSEIRQITLSEAALGGTMNIAPDDSVLDVKLNDAGQIYVAWQSLAGFALVGIDSPSAGAQSYLFGGTGVQAGFFNNTSPQLALVPGGVAMLLGKSQSGPYVPMRLQIYDSSGAVLHEQYIEDTDAYYYPSVASNRSGELIVTWASSNGSAFQRKAILAQLFDRHGMPTSDPLTLVSTRTDIFADTVELPKTIADEGGLFTVAWTHVDSDGISTSVEMARVRYGGQVVETSISVLDGNEGYVRLAGSSAGNDFVVTGAKSGASCNIMGQLALDGELDSAVPFAATPCFSGVYSAITPPYDVDLLHNGDILLARLLNIGGNVNLTATRLYRPAIVQIGNASVVEGNPQSGQGPLALANVSLSRAHALGEPVTVNYATVDGSALNGFDYQYVSGSLQFNGPSDLSQTISVPIVPDNEFELNELFTVQLESTGNAVIRRGGDAGTVTIVNDDQTPAIEPDCDNFPPAPCRQVAEPLPGESTLLSLTLTMAQPVGSDIAFSYHTEDGTAEAGSDYQSVSGTVSILAGSTGASISIPILGDDVLEGTEAFTLELSAPSNINLPYASLEIQILDDTLCFVELTPTGHNVPLAGGSRSFNVDTPADCSWTATSQVTWAQVTGGASGMGPGTVDYDVDLRSDQETPPRLGEIHVVTNFESAVHTVEQDGDPNYCNFVATPDAVNIGAAAGSGSIGVTTTNDCPWEAFSDDSWLTLTAPSGPVSGNGSIAFSASANVGAPNVETAARSSSLDAPFGVTVNQSGCSFSLASSSASVGAAGDDAVPVDVLAPTADPGPCKWTAVSNTSWILVVQGASGSGGGQTVLDVLENPSVQPRTGSVQVGDEIFVVNQDGDACSYDLDPALHSITPDGGSLQANISASAGCSWSLSPDDGWLTVSSNDNGDGDETAGVTVSPNLSESTRSATLQLLDSGSAVRASSSVSQAGYLVYEPFDTTPPDWLFTPGGYWSVDGSALLGNFLDAGEGFAIDQSATGACSNCRPEAVVRLTSFSSESTDNLALVGWYSSPDNYVALAMDEYANVWRLVEMVDGVPHAVQVAVAQIVPNADYHLALSYDGNSFHGSVDGVELLQLAQQSAGTALGYGGFRVNDSNARFDELRVAGNAESFAPTLVIGPPSEMFTHSGPVSFAVTYTGASGINLTESDVSLQTTGDAAATVSVTDGGTATPTVTLSALSGDGSIAISIAAGTAQNGGGIPAPAAGPSDAVTVQNAPTDLAISISDDADPVMPGSTVNYAITVSNDGPSWTNDVTVAFTVPAAFNSTVTTGCINDPAGVPSCELGELASGADVSVTLSGTLDGALDSGSVMLEVAVSGDLVDSDGSNNNASESTLVDADPPIVVSVDADGQAVAECSELRLPFATLAVTFDEALRDTGGGAALGDVSNPASYRLFAAGADRDLSSVDCGVAQGDDLSIPITGVAWDTPSTTATLSLGGTLPLSSGPYRLLVCADTRDIAGNALDGDGNGSGGDAFLRSYRLELGNVFVNGQLDCDLPPWLAMSETQGTITTATDDVDGASISGSALFDNLGGSPQPYSLVQCVPVADDMAYRLSADMRIDAAAGLPVLLARTCSYFASGDCSGTALSSESGSQLLNAGSADWVTVVDNLRPVAGSQSALCGFSAQQPSGQPFTGLLDNLRLEQVIVLFGDGFESP